MEQNKIEAFLAANQAWVQADGALTAMWSFDSFTKVKTEIPRLCELFEELNHHPTVSFGYNFIRIETTTHDKGNVVTEKDIAVAQKVSELLDS